MKSLAMSITWQGSLKDRSFHDFCHAAFAYSEQAGFRSAVTVSRLNRSLAFSARSCSLNCSQTIVAVIATETTTHKRCQPFNLIAFPLSNTRSIPLTRLKAAVEVIPLSGNAAQAGLADPFRRVPEPGAGSAAFAGSRIPGFLRFGPPVRAPEHSIRAGSPKGVPEGSPPYCQRRLLATARTNPQPNPYRGELNRWPPGTIRHCQPLFGPIAKKATSNRRHRFLPAGLRHCGGCRLSVMLRLDLKRY